MTFFETQRILIWWHSNYDIGLQSKISNAVRFSVTFCVCCLLNGKAINVFVYFDELLFFSFCHSNKLMINYTLLPDFVYINFGVI